jgi:predicted TIM-barrel fold metal-dependent hydrolase
MRSTRTGGRRRIGIDRVYGIGPSWREPSRTDGAGSPARLLGNPAAPPDCRREAPRQAPGNRGGRAMSGRKIDTYNHVMPRAIADRMRELAPGKGDILKRMTSIPMLYDIEARIGMMEQWPEYQQVLTLANPPIETIAGPGDSPDLARRANDELARICAGRPDKFPAWVASLPLNNIEATLAEIDRAVAAGARGVQIFTNVDGRPLDDPAFFPVFEHACRVRGLAIWMHPARDAPFADYRGEEKSKYEIWQVLGWPYETSVAMARLVFSGLFDTLPELTIVTHHLGAMIPYFEGRVGPLWDQLGSRTSDEDYRGILAAMRQKGRRPIDYFRLFHNDTAVGSARSAIRCGLDFFGADRVLFATDCPFDPEGGPMFIRETITPIDGLALAAEDSAKIYFRNALRMLKLAAA